MRESRTASVYRQEGDWYLIDLKLKTLAQLYNSLDPAPFYERDLDNDAADYIREAVEELRAHPKIKLVVHLQETLDVGTAEQVGDAIRHYYEYRAHTNRVELRQQLRMGRISLMVGLIFLAFCFEISTLISASTGTVPSILREGIIIIGWVAMWKPLDIFLYSWWPILGKIRLYERISCLPIEIKDCVIS